MSRLTFARHLGFHAAKAAGPERAPLKAEDPIPADDKSKLASTYPVIDDTVEQAYRSAFNTGSLEH